MTHELTAPSRILRIRALCLQIGLSRSTIYDRLNPRSPRFDLTFPRPVKLGCSAVGWVEAEVIAWLATKMAARIVPDKPLLASGTGRSLHGFDDSTASDATPARRMRKRCVRDFTDIPLLMEGTGAEMVATTQSEEA